MWCQQQCGRGRVVELGQGPSASGSVAVAVRRPGCRRPPVVVMVAPGLASSPAVLALIPVVKGSATPVAPVFFDQRSILQLHAFMRVPVCMYRHVPAALTPSPTRTGGDKRVEGLLHRHCHHRVSFVPTAGRKATPMFLQPLLGRLSFCILPFMHRAFLSLLLIAAALLPGKFSGLNLHGEIGAG